MSCCPSCCFCLVHDRRLDQMGLAPIARLLPSCRSTNRDMLANTDIAQVTVAKGEQACIFLAGWRLPVAGWLCVQQQAAGFLPLVLSAAALRHSTDQLLTIGVFQA